VKELHKFTDLLRGVNKVVKGCSQMGGVREEGGCSRSQRARGVYIQTQR
jgi:hypothetical protein